MQNRRTFLGIAAASLLPTGIDAQAPTPRPPNGPTRALVFMLVPKGSPLTSPV